MMQLTRDSKRALLRIQRAVDKFNAIRNEILSRGGSEDDVYYDNSSTYDSGTTYASEMKFLGLVDNYHERGPAVVVEFQMKLNSYEKELSEENIVGWVEEYEGEFTFDYERMLDDIRYYTNCVRRALRLWKEYNPSDEDEEGNNRKWERSEAARDVEERFIMKKNNSHIIGEAYGYTHPWEPTDEEMDAEDFDYSRPSERQIAEIEREIKANWRGKPLIETEYGELYICTERGDDGTFYIGCGYPLGNFGMLRCDYKVPFDFSKSVEDNLYDLMDELEQQGVREYGYDEGDDGVYGESVDADRAFNASTFSRMKWLGE